MILGGGGKMVSMIISSCKFLIPYPHAEGPHHTISGILTPRFGSYREKADEIVVGI
jgi:hypothetical protein